MESLISFILDNIFWIFMAILFLSGFIKPKKKRGELEDNDIPPLEDDEDYEYYEDDEDFEPYEQQQSPKKPFNEREILDNLPIPQELKELFQEDDWEEDSPWKGQKTKKKFAPVSESLPVMVKRSAATDHYDAPWSGEGKIFPHAEVRPSYGEAETYGGKSKSVVQPSVSSKSSIVLPKGEKANSLSKADADVYEDVYNIAKSKQYRSLTGQKIAEAVVMAEILAKPKALRKTGSRL